MASTGTRRSTIVKRRQGKLAVMIPWLKRFGLVLGLAIAVIWVGAWLWWSGLAGKMGVWSEEEALALSAKAGFRVENILVENREHTDPAILMAIINTEKGDPLFSFRPAEAKALIEKINWVKSVHIERRWPDTIYIRLEERKPVALWQHQKKLQLIDAQGVVVTGSQLDQFPGLMIVVGEHAPAHIESLLREISKDESFLKRIASAKWVGDRRWDLKLYSKTVIRLPETDIKPALELLAQMQREENILDKDIISLDLREPGRITVQPAAGAVVNYKGAPANAAEGDSI